MNDFCLAQLRAYACTAEALHVYKLTDPKQEVYPTICHTGIKLKVGSTVL